MAIFNSIALMSVRGSIGNLTMTKLKGQNVAKSKVQPTKKPPTPDQLIAQTRLANIVKAWGVIKLFLAHTNALRKLKESKYNAFVRMFCNYMYTWPASDGWSAIIAITNVQVYVGNFIGCGLPTITPTTYTVPFNTGGSPFIPKSYITAIKYRINNNTQMTVHHLITPQEWSALTVTFAMNMGLGTFITGHYAYNYGLKKCSEPIFRDITLT